MCVKKSTILVDPFLWEEISPSEISNLTLSFSILILFLLTLSLKTDSDGQAKYGIYHFLLNFSIREIVWLWIEYFKLEVPQN